MSEEGGSAGLRVGLQLSFCVPPGSLQQYGGPYKLQVQKSVTVQEGLCVLVPCSFSYPYHAWPSFGQFYMSWLRVQYTPYGDYPVATNNQRHALQKEIKDRFQLLGNIWTRNCSLSIRGAKMEDTGTYVFRIEQKEQRYYEEIQTHVYVDSPLNLQVTGRQSSQEVTSGPEPPHESRNWMLVRPSAILVMGLGRSKEHGTCTHLDPEAPGTVRVTLDPTLGSRTSLSPLQPSQRNLFCTFLSLWSPAVPLT